MSTDLIIEIVKFTAFLFILIKSADYFVRYSEKLGLSLGVPQFIIGITVISIGTSLPELVTSLFSVFEGETGFVAGNVIGSNIANILLVIGVSTIIAKKIEISRSLIRLDLPLLVASGTILILTLKDGIFTFTEAIISIVGFVIYIIYSIYSHKETIGDKEEKIMKKLKIDGKPPFKWSYVVYILASCVAIFFAAKLTISSTISIATFLNLDTAIIAISAVAIGTSLPELLVAGVSAKKGNFDLAIGNVIGSNIFNGFLVMGIPGLISPLEVPESIINLGIPFFIIATVLLVFSGIERKFYNFEGAFYLLIYLLFIGQLFNFI